MMNDAVGQQKDSDTHISYNVLNFDFVKKANILFGFYAISCY